MKNGNTELLAEGDHRALARWAADCAERVLSHFEAKSPDDHRPRDAIEATRAWARGELRVGQARIAAVAAHASAREVSEGAARAAARAAGQAVGTAHMAGHARHAAAYAIKAVRCAASPADAAAAAAAEHAWQVRHLVKRLRPLVFLAGEA